MTVSDRAPTYSRRSQIRHLVAGRVLRLQEGYLSGGSSERGALAALRKGFALGPGQNPEVWELTSVPADADVPFDTPTWSERAVHDALTLYSWHQQSRNDPMHTQKRTLSRAVGELVYRKRDNEGQSKAVRRRFDAAVTATTERELVHHLRGLIGQLRSEGIAFDYGELASDLYQFQAPGGASTVRLKWARQFAGLPAGEKEKLS